jgi:hypothetical protein
MVNLLKIASLLIEDALRWVLLLFRSAESLRTENLLLRRQLALYIDLANEVTVGRPPSPQELRELIRRMARENVLWGEERIANELLLKLGIRISPRTVRKYLPKRPPGRPRGDLRWSTFLKSMRAPSSPAISSSPLLRRFGCCTCSSSSSTAHADWHT